MWCTGIYKTPIHTKQTSVNHIWYSYNQGFSLLISFCRLWTAEQNGVATGIINTISACIYKQHYIPWNVLGYCFPIFVPWQTSVTTMPSAWSFGDSLCHFIVKKSSQLTVVSTLIIHLGTREMIAGWFWRSSGLTVTGTLPDLFMASSLKR